MKITNWLSAALLFFACLFATMGCEQKQSGSLTQECNDILTEPECKQCCLSAGASEYDFDLIDDDDQDLMCTCIKPTR